MQARVDSDVPAQGEPQLLTELLQRRRIDAVKRLAIIDPPDRARTADGPALRLTWADIAARVDRLSLELLHAGIGKGSVVMTPSPTLHETIVGQLAIIRLGAICAPVPIQYREHELHRLMDAVSPAAIVGFGRLGRHDHMAMLHKMIAERGDDMALLGYGGSLPDGVVALDARAAEPLSHNEARMLAEYDAALRLSPDDAAFIVFSSGSEDNPKAVLRSHRDKMKLRRFLAELGGLQEGACFLSPRLLNTIGAITNGLVPWLDLGACMVLHQPFDIEVFLQQIRDERPEMTSCPPGILHMILQRAEAGETLDLSSLHHITSGSAHLNPAVMHAFRERFGIEIANVYGSSEGALLVSSEHDMPDPEQRAACFPAFGWNGFVSSLGFARAVETRLVSPETGEVVTDPGIPAELRIRGGALFKSYWNDPDRSARAFDDQGYYRTGDLFEHVTADRPSYRFVGRLRNLIVRGGLNISAEELEGLLHNHPAVAEVCVVGRPDEKLGETVAVIAVPRPGATITMADLITYLRDQRQVAVFKLPQHLCVVDHLPRSGGNKVDLAACRALAARNQN